MWVSVEGEITIPEKQTLNREQMYQITNNNVPNCDGVSAVTAVFPWAWSHSLPIFKGRLSGYNLVNGTGEMKHRLAEFMHFNLGNMKSIH